MTTDAHRDPAAPAERPSAVEPRRHDGSRAAVQAALAADVAEALTGGDPLEVALGRCAEAMVRHLDAAFARIWTLDEAADTLVLRASAGMYTHLDGAHARVPVGSLKIGLIAREQRPHITNDVQHDPRVGDHAWAAREGMVAFAGYPLRVAGRLAGVAALFARRPLAPDTLDALAALADTIALGIERRRLMAVTQASEAQFRTLVETMPLLAWYADPSGAITWGNRRWHEYGADGGVGAAHWSDVRDPTEPDAALDRWREALARGEPWEDTVPLRRRDGAVRWFLSRALPLRDERGAVARWLGTHVDIDAQVRSAQAQAFLAEAGAQLASSIDYETTLASVARLAVPRVADWCAVDVLAEDGSIELLAVAHVDPEKAELARELRRRRPPRRDDPGGVAEVVRSGRSEVLADVSDEQLAAAARDPDELALLRSLGLRSSMCVPLTAHGRTLGAVTLVSAAPGRRYDEGDQRLAEELARRAAYAVENAQLYDEVRRLNASLERRVEERTAQLVESNRELETFSYTVSHDLRAPIRHMGGFVDLLQRHAGDKLDEKGRRYVQTIGAAARQMGALIDALLAFSRIGRAAIASAPVDTEALVQDVLRDLEPETAGRDVAWSVAPLPVVLGDATLLRLVFSNLLGNAVKYTRPRARAHIAVEARAVDDGAAAEFTVRDDGVGFRPEYAGKLFGVFQRLHGDAQFEGTGIGLATVRRIVQRHGGRVRADGVEGAGAAFSFTLPVPGGTPTPP